MQRKWIVAIIAVLLLGLGAGWYFGSPYWTLREMRAAAVEGDADALAEHIDFESVRTSLREQLQAQMAAEMARQQNANNPFAALGMALANSMVGTIVDSVVTKEGMRQMMIAGRPRGPQQQTEALGEPVDYNLERDGLDKFTVTPITEDEKVPSFVFERDGLSWKMTEIRIPEGGLGQRPTQ